MRAKDVAARLGVTEGRISQLRKTGDIPSLDEAGIRHLHTKRELRAMYKNARWQRDCDWQDAVLQQLKEHNQTMQLILMALTAHVVKR